MHRISRVEGGTSEPDNSDHPDDEKCDVAQNVENPKQRILLLSLIISITNPESVGVASAVAGTVVCIYLLHSAVFNVQCTMMEKYHVKC